MPDLNTDRKTGMNAVEQLQSLHSFVSFVIGAENTNAINVALQLKDARTGLDLAERRSVLAYLSSVATGDALVGTALDTVAIGTDGVLIPLIAGKCFLLTSEADGDIDITITEDATGSYYLVVICEGILHVSPAITFA